MSDVLFNGQEPDPSDRISAADRKECFVPLACLRGKAQGPMHTEENSNFRNQRIQDSDSEVINFDYKVTCSTV